MKIKELMEELKKYDENIEVMVDYYDGWNNSLCKITDTYISCLYDHCGYGTKEQCLYLNARE